MYHEFRRRSTLSGTTPEIGGSIWGTICLPSHWSRAWMSADKVMTIPLSAQRATPAADLASATKGRFHFEDVYPSVDCGRFPVKRICGEPIEIWGDVLREGHDVLAAQLLWRRERDAGWQRVAMHLHDNDRWTASFVPAETGFYVYAFEAWTDEFATWRRDFLVKRAAGQDIRLEAS